MCMEKTRIWNRQSNFGKVGQSWSAYTIRLQRFLQNYRNYDSMVNFSGGTVDKNLSPNAGDMGSVPGLGRSHMPLSNLACVPQLLSLSASTTEACALRAFTLQREKPLSWEAHTPQRRVAPAHGNETKPGCSDKDPAQPKVIK